MKTLKQFFIIYIGWFFAIPVFFFILFLIASFADWQWNQELINMTGDASNLRFFRAYLLLLLPNTLVTLFFIMMAEDFDKVTNQHR